MTNSLGNRDTLIVTDTNVWQQLVQITANIYSKERKIKTDQEWIERELSDKLYASVQV